MPIRPENQARYPKDWAEISKRIRRRARNRCECRGECGLRHHRVKGKQIDLPPELQIKGTRAFRCAAVNGDPHPVTKSKVVLTTAHLNHKPEDCADTNLKAMCQKCHLTYDRHHHASNRRRTRELKTGQGTLNV